MTAKLLINQIIEGLRTFLFRENNKPESIKILTGINDTNLDIISQEVKRRLNYFNININIEDIEKINIKDMLNFELIGLVNNKSIYNNLSKIKKNDVFKLNYNNYYLDGWEYHKLLSRMNQDIVKEGIIHGKQKIKELKQKNKIDQAYIFGTGPSLEKAIDKEWKTGIKIVSNTIVKDLELWEHINPQFIVASDAIYHFGISKFSEAFREDLKKCLKNSQAYFVYPAIFHIFCLSMFSEFKDRLIPIPHGKVNTIHHDLSKLYELPDLGNVLPQILLPLACTFSVNIGFWGFDGRAPDDKMFWKNSSKHFYNEHVEELKVLHPAFFEELLPKKSPETYVKRVHGDVLERLLTMAEKDGYKFNMLHASFTETLNKRFNEAV
ncbi:hypothetical protein [Spirosoma foliorum]|uniref:Uncharacterized protein n=1 Tax=Spirosoma foliorum TaxID=2710596 RepID=A0A7G5H0E1_9BACT|nr:hypothetical protein [Spirosoma foliorum]QMW04583.1 hypothetical protein H3H32_06515 [Spirosoma foliorum]